MYVDRYIWLWDTMIDIVLKLVLNKENKNIKNVITEISK